jgi:hypothetical protein
MIYRLVRGVLLGALLTTCCGCFAVQVERQIASGETRQLKQQFFLLGRVGEPEDIWQAVKFCLECDYFNGRVIDVDGGQAYSAIKCVFKLPCTTVFMSLPPTPLIYVRTPEDRTHACAQMVRAEGAYRGLGQRSLQGAGCVEVVSDRSRVGCSCAGC